MRSVFFLFLSAVFLALSAYGQDASPRAEFLEDSGFARWCDDLKIEAEARGVSRNTLASAFSGLTPNPRVVELDQVQPSHKTLTLSRYLKRVLPKKKIDKARAKLQEHQPILQRISKAYSVPPRFVVALWGVESEFGSVQGNFQVISSLATLAYEGRRAEFFRGELFDALTILDQGHISLSDMKGSWAGAMGQTQFMPSSFLKMAVDFDQDGKRDIWNNKADALASIANYLHTKGWDPTLGWGREVRVPKGFDASLFSKEVVKPLSEWKKMGVTRADGGALPSRAVEASLVRPEENTGKIFAIYPNARVLLDWNRSLYFLISVGTLADHMGSR